MIDLTTDAKNNIKKREPIIPLSPCIMYMYMYKYTVWAIPIPNFNYCPFIIPKEKKQFHDNNNNNNNNNIISTKTNVHCTTLKGCI